MNTCRRELRRRFYSRMEVRTMSCISCKSWAKEHVLIAKAQKSLKDIFRTLTIMTTWLRSRKKSMQRFLNWDSEDIYSKVSFSRRSLDKIIVAGTQEITIDGKLGTFTGEMHDVEAHGYGCWNANDESYAGNWYMNRRRGFGKFNHLFSLCVQVSGKTNKISIFKGNGMARLSKNLDNLVLETSDRNY